MSPNLTMISGGKKCMWDGRLFDTREDAVREAAVYEQDRFEVRMAEQEEKFLVYTRRAVKEVVVTGQ